MPVTFATPLRNRTYVRLFVSQVISLLGTGISTVALALLAYELSGGNAGIVLGTALALKMISYVIVAPVAGAFSHHISRRKLLIGLDVIRALSVLLLPFVSEIWHIYVLILIISSASAAFTPVFQATIPDLFPDEKVYTRALSLSRLAYDIEKLLSPSIAAFVLLFASFDALFAANSIAFLLSAALILATRLPRQSPNNHKRGLLGQLGFGMMNYFKTPRLRALLGLCFCVSAAGAMMIVNTVVYVREHLSLDERDVALAMVCAGMGSIVAAILVPRLIERFGERRLMLPAGFILSVMLGLILLGPTFSGLALLWLMMGLSSSLILTPSGRLLRRSAISGDLPALFAAQFSLSHACWLVTYPLAGFLGVTYGLEATAGILAGMAFVGALSAVWLWPRYDPEIIMHEHHRLTHEHLHVHDFHHSHSHSHEEWEGTEPHSHPHTHAPVRHAHSFAIDMHHPHWPESAG
jgi:predicted MFS family arabinose efflux permease